MFNGPCRCFVTLVVAGLLAAPGAASGAEWPPEPPTSCATPLTTGARFEADDVRLGPGDDHFRPADEGSSAQTFVFGEGGADCLLGTNGYDTLDGGAQNDRLIGRIGPDELVGGAGDDQLLTGGEDGSGSVSGGEAVNAGTGDDVVIPGPGATEIRLGPGNDRVLGTDGSNGPIDCGPGEDTVVADAGDRLTGCEHVTRRPPLAVTVTRRGAEVTARLRAPWRAPRRRDDLLGYKIALDPPRGVVCGGLRPSVTTTGRSVVAHLRPGRARVCPGRWSAQFRAVFAHDPGAECDGGGCGLAHADVGRRIVFRVR